MLANLCFRNQWATGLEAKVISRDVKPPVGRKESKEVSGEI